MSTTAERQKEAPKELTFGHRTNANPLMACKTGRGTWAISMVAVKPLITTFSTLSIIAVVLKNNLIF
jgi:hypothetical protein